MQTWDYHLTFAEFDLSSPFKGDEILEESQKRALTQEVRKWGAQGWELVSTTLIQKGSRVMLLMTFKCPTT